MNLVVLIGRLASDPELKYTPSGDAVCGMRIAVDCVVKKGAEKKADFFNLVAWRQSAEYAANYLTKGRLIAIEGKLKSKNWVQQDGQKRSGVDVVVNSINGLDRPKTGQESTHNAGSGGPSTPAMSYDPSQDYGDMDYDPFAEE